MNANLFARINAHFIEKEYTRIPTDQENVRMYAVYDKTSVYLINVIALAKEYKFDPVKYNHYKEITRKQFKHVRADKVILVNLILTADPHSIYEVVNVAPEVESDFVDVSWIIDEVKETLIIPKKQLHAVMDLKREMEGVLGHKQEHYFKLHRHNKVSVVTWGLIVMNILIWVLMERSGGSTEGEVLLAFGALYAPNVLEGHEYYRLLTSEFLHIGISHLVFNMFSLYIFGARLEKYFPVAKFLGIYLFSAVFASAFSMTIHLLLGYDNLSAGASGAVYGLIGSIVVSSKLTGKSIEGLNAYMMIIYFIMGMAASFMTPGIDAAGHVGGFIGGILITILMMKIHVSHNHHKEGDDHEASTHR